MRRYLLSAILLMPCARYIAQEPKLATPSSTAVINANAQAAVDLVTRVYNINPFAKVEASGKPLDRNGAWSARVALPEERTAACEAPGAVCIEVIYRAGQPQITCQWTVLFPAGGGAAIIARDNEASATYMMVDAKSEPDKTRAKQRTGPFEVLGLKPGDAGYPTYIRGAEPDFQKQDAELPMTGVVSLRLIVDTKGDVCGAYLERSTDDVLTQPVARAAAQYKFRPLLLDGRAQNFVVHLQMNTTIIGRK